MTTAPCSICGLTGHHHLLTGLLSCIRALKGNLEKAKDLGFGSEWEIIDDDGVQKFVPVGTDLVVKLIKSMEAAAAKADARNADMVAALRGRDEFIAQLQKQLEEANKVALESNAEALRRAHDADEGDKRRTKEIERVLKERDEARAALAANITDSNKRIAMIAKERDEALNGAGQAAIDRDAAWSMIHALHGCMGLTTGGSHIESKVGAISAEIQKLQFLRSRYAACLRSVTRWLTPKIQPGDEDSEEFRTIQGVLVTLAEEDRAERQRSCPHPWVQLAGDKLQCCDCDHTGPAADFPNSKTKPARGRDLLNMPCRFCVNPECRGRCVA